MAPEPKNMDSGEILENFFLGGGKPYHLLGKPAVRFLGSIMFFVFFFWGGVVFSDPK